MITFERGRTRFTYRVTGICIHDGHVLLHRAETDDFWALPGGRCEMGESSDVTLRREMQEELGVTVTVGRLLWVVENFFILYGTAHHELGLYYAVDFPVGHRYLAKDREHAGIEDTHPDGQRLALIFRWFPVADLTAAPFHPSFLRTALREVPGTTQHVVYRDMDD